MLLPIPLNKKIIIFIFGVIFVIGLFVRFYRLDEYPVGFHGDEASLVYNGYSLLKTARDENGVFLPIHSFISQTYRPIGYTYLTIPSIMLFGLTEFSARFPAALLGSLSVGVLFFLVLFVSRSPVLSLLSAFFLAINPWHIIISRASAESMTGLFFLLVSLYFFLRVIYTREKIILFSLITILSAAASFICYQSPRIVLPLLLLIVSLLSWIKKRDISSVRIAFFILGIVVLFDAFLIFGTSAGTVKFKHVGIIDYVESRALLDESIREDGSSGSPLVTRFFHNKLKMHTATFFDQFFKYFTYDYLFQGDILPIRYYIHQAGLLHMVELPLILLGIYVCITRIKKAAYWLPLIVLLAGPVAAALTWEDTPNVLRSLPMVIAFPMLSAHGLYWLYLKADTLAKKRLFVVSSAALCLYSVLYFGHQYYVHGKAHRPWYREYGFKEVAAYLEPIIHEYDSVIFTKAYSGAYIHLLFHLKYDPGDYIETQGVRDESYKGFGKFIFVPTDCPTIEELMKSGKFAPEFFHQKNIIVGKGECIDEDASYRELALIKLPDNNPVFKIWEYEYTRE